MSKNLFKSKTFWTAIAGAVIDYGGLLGAVGVPPGAMTYIMSGAMIGLRVISKGAVHVIKDAATEP